MSPLEHRIEIADFSHLAELVEHDIRHMREPGFEGLLAHPFPVDHPWDKTKMMNDKLKSWGSTLNEEFWSRSFLLFVDNEIVGHLNLKNKFFQSLHRAQLGMGIEQKARHMGLGKKLMEAALNWARTQESIEWIDLTVLAHNTPAKKLYASFGFEEICTIPDCLRVNGVSIDDTIMALKLRK